MKQYFPWILRAVVAFLLLQTLFFKFGAHEESVALFTNITNNVPFTPNNEAAFRIGTGVIELIASILILIPRTTGWGAGIAFGTMLGAIATHLYLGLFDQLFVLAFIVAAVSAALLWMYRHQLPILKNLGKTAESAAA